MVVFIPVTRAQRSVRYFFRVIVVGVWRLGELSDALDIAWNVLREIRKALVDYINVLSRV